MRCLWRDHKKLKAIRKELENLTEIENFMASLSSRRGRLWSWIKTSKLMKEESLIQFPFSEVKE